MTLVLCVSLCTGHFVMVPLKLTYLHCLQHIFFEHLFNLNLYVTFNVFHAENWTFLKVKVDVCVRYYRIFAFCVPTLCVLRTAYKPSILHTKSGVTPSEEETEERRDEVARVRWRLQALKRPMEAKQTYNVSFNMLRAR